MFETPTLREIVYGIVGLLAGMTLSLVIRIVKKNTHLGHKTKYDQSTTSTDQRGSSVGGHQVGRDLHIQ